jgi:15-cis-phytoene synthase
VAQRKKASDGIASAGSLGAAYDYCRDVTRHHARSFYFCAQFLPAEKRRAIYAVYALCRHIDDFVDAAGGRPSDATRSILDEWRGELRDGGTSTHPVLRAWRDAASVYGVDSRC